MCLAAVTVRADSIPTDARIIVGHGSDPGGPHSCGLKFKIHLNGKGGGIKNCQNTSGQNWIGLDIFATIAQGDSVSCITPISRSPDAPRAVFSSCKHVMQSFFDHKENIEIILSGGTIGSGDPFFINLNGSGNSTSSDPSGSGGWFSFEGGNLDAAAVTATPEPSSILLLASGMGLLSFLRRQFSFR